MARSGDVRARVIADRRSFGSATVALLMGTAVSLFLAAAANAQTSAGPAETASMPAQESDGAADVAQDSLTHEIIVTGSRAAVNGFSAPTPTQIVGADLIARQAATNVANVLNQSPAFKPTRTPGSNNTSVASPAQATVDLRGLGSQRTLVLLNGARVVPYAPASNTGGTVSSVDLNMIPALMIDRVEVVTGGASAQYGSDAVSGVVNVLLKKRMQGVEITAQKGISGHGDFATTRLGFVAGTSFADDRLNVIVGADYDKNDGVGDVYTRDWGRDLYGIVTNNCPLAAAVSTNCPTGGNGLPALVFGPGMVNQLGAGGVIVSATRPAGAVGGTAFNNASGQSLIGQTFNADRTIRRFNYGTVRGGTNQLGGEGESIIKGTSLVPASRRFTAHGRIELQASDAITLYVEGGYSESRGDLDNVPYRLTAQQIRRDNAFLPPAVAAALALPANQNITSFSISRIGTNDIGLSSYTITNQTPHGVIGIEGKLGGTWRFDAHYSYGRNSLKSNTFNNANSARLAFAVDAVVNPTNGQITCRALLPSSGATQNAAAAGCVPMNLFGEGSPSAASIDYVNGFVGESRVRYVQQTAAANLRGEPFSTWAAPVSMAAGVEYRRETQTLTADPVASVNGFLSAGNAVPYSGRFDVKEGYVEAIVPLARDLPFAHSLDLNGAIRYADYSTVKGQTTWKVGGVYAPAEGLRLRATRSRDIRAPALFELFSPGVNVTIPITVAGVTATVPQNASKGNPNLGPERADTTTVGFVLEPRSGGLRGLSLSVDYYDINVKGAIANLSAGNVATLCTQEIAATGSRTGQFCQFFTFNGTTPTSLVASALNIGSFHTKGIDGILSYRKDLSAWGMSGQLAASLSGSYTLNSLVNTGFGPTVDRAGEDGAGNLAAVPRFRGNFSLGYTADSWSLTLQALYISKGTIDNLYNSGPAALQINHNSIPAVTYWNLYGSFDVAPRFNLFWAVNNLLDKDPPPSPLQTINAPVNGQYYDKVGRSFMAGVKVRL